MIKGEEMENAGQLTVAELCDRVEKWLVERHFASAGIYTYKTIQKYENQDSSIESIFLTFRFLLLGCLAALAGMYDGGGGLDSGQLLSVATGLLKRIEEYCGGGLYIATKILKRPPGVPFLTDRVSLPGNVTSLFQPCFESTIFMETFLEEVAQVVLALHSLLAIASRLRRCHDKDDKHREEVCDNIGKASCFIGCMKQSEVKLLLQSCLASIEGNWSESQELLRRATAKSNDDVARALLSVLDILMGKIPENISDIPVDTRQLLSRCKVLGGRAIDIEAPNEAPQSVGGLLELADELFAARNMSEATVLLDRCEELLTCNRKVNIEHCGIRNYRSELLYQRGRLLHAYKKRPAAAYTMYESSLSYCSHHLAALYQITRISDVPPEGDEVREPPNPYTNFPVVLDQISRAGAANLKSLCVFREILKSEDQTILEGVDRVLDCEVDELELKRMKLEVLVKLISNGCTKFAAMETATAIIMEFMRLSVSYIPKEAVTKHLEAMRQVFPAYNQSDASAAAAAPPQEAEKMAEEDVNDDLFGDDVTETTRELTTDEVLWLVMTRHTIPMRWVLILAKYYTDMDHKDSLNVWRVIRFKLKHHQTAEIGTLISLYMRRDYTALHTRLKKVLGESRTGLDPHSREVMCIRILSHIVRADLSVARQIVERALYYADEQITVTGGLNAYHWQSLNIYVELLVLTRIGNPYECVTKKLLENVFKKESKRRREDSTCVAMPNELRSKIQMLIAWMISLQAKYSYAILMRGDTTKQIKKNYKALYNEAKKLAMQAVETCSSNWRAALVVAECCKGLKQYPQSAKICSLVGEYVNANSTLKEKEYVNNYLLKETAYGLVHEKPTPPANRGKLLKAVKQILEQNIGVCDFLVNLARCTKDPKLADAVYTIILQHITCKEGTDVKFDETPLKLTMALARVGGMSCMERAKDTAAIKDPEVLAALIKDAEMVASAYRHVLIEQQRYTLESPPPYFVPEGPAALEYLTHKNQPVIGPMATRVGITLVENKVTAYALDELPNVESIQQRLVEDIEALISRLTELQPLVCHEFATACAVREEKMRESSKLLKDMEASFLN